MKPHRVDADLAELWALANDWALGHIDSREDLIECMTQITDHRPDLVDAVVAEICSVMAS